MTDSDREPVRRALRDFFKRRQAETPEFIPGKTYIPVTAKSCDEDDLLALGEAAMDLWLTSGRFAREFEKKIATQFSRPFSLFVNSGSSANLLAVAALCARGLKEKRLNPGDEVITVAAGFPTTVNPLLQNGLTPVLVDVELGHYNTTPERVAAAIGPKTRAIALAHTLGNPFRADLIAKLAAEKGLYFIEDCCDALGARIGGKHVGSFGELATLSFYPAHHITTGEGGAVIVKDGSWKRLVESLRDWGRDCWCEPGKDNTCKKRFGWQMGELPKGYDHKYIYTEIGFNMKATDMQAAVGLSQLAKLEGFVARRRANFAELTALLSSDTKLMQRLELPRAVEGTEPSWFGYPIRCLKGIERDQVVRRLEQEARIGTRLMFAGNITRQPAYADAGFRVAGELKNSDVVMNDVFWIGVHPALDKTQLEYMAEKLAAIVKAL
jgi:CDP-6-deoxy-D-xylo-4-hexulose-3-dehydrase